MRSTHRTSSRITAAALSVLLLATLIPPAVFAQTLMPRASMVVANALPEATAPTTERVYGSNRYETAIAVSQRAFSSADTVILATGEMWADALVANPLATALGAPVLLTPSSSLPSAVWDEIDRLGATHVVVLGGESAVSGDVLSALVANGIALNDIERLGGRDRYDTAVRVAERVMIHRGMPERVVMTTGQTYPDALAVAGFAARSNMPILLTHPEYMPAATSRAIDLLSPAGSLVIGGEAAVSSQVATLLPLPERVGGVDRYDTARLIAEYAFVNGLSYETAFVATGENFADALAAGPWISAVAGQMVLTAPQTLSPATDEFFNDHCSSIEEVFVVGGPAAVAEGILTAIGEAATSEYNTDEVQVMSPAAGSALETMTAEGTLSFDAGQVDPASIETSDVLIAEPCSAAPDGYLVRVLSVTEVAGKVTVETTEASLADVIVKGSLDVTGTIPAEAEPIDGALSVGEATAVDDTHVDVELDGMLLETSQVSPEARLGSANISFETTVLEKGNASVTAEGTLDMSADYSLNVSWGYLGWGRWGLKKIKFKVYMKNSVSLKVRADYAISGEAEIALASIRLPNFTYMIGPVPVVFKNTLTPVIGVSGSFGAGVEVEVRHTARVTGGIYWHHDTGWNQIKSSSNSFGFDVGGGVSANAQAWLGARINSKLYGRAGPYVQPEVYLDFDASTSKTPYWWTLDAGLRLKYGASIKGFGKRLKVTWTSNLYERNIAHAPGAWPSSTEAPVAVDSEWTGAYDDSGGFVMPGSTAVAINSSSVDASDFTIDGLTVTDAQVQPDGRTVRLTTSQHARGQGYVVRLAEDSIVSEDGQWAVTSSDAFLGYTPPLLTSVSAVDSRTVDLAFDTASRLETASVETSDFTIPGLTVTAADLQSDGTTVRLTTDPQASMTRYRAQVDASRLTDRDYGWANVQADRGFLGRLRARRVSLGMAWLIEDGDGRLWTIGQEGYPNVGQMGDGTYDDHPTDPVGVDIAGTGFLDVECSRKGMFAVRNDGTLWAWGDNEYGQLGIGSAGGYQPSPTQVGAGIDWVDVSGGWYATAGIDSAGNLYTWGTDTSGCLGNGASGSVYAPALVGTGFSQLAVGKQTMVAIKSDGTLWGWGENGQGEIDGSLTDRLTPTQMGAASDWVDIAAGGYWVEALDSSGHIFHGGTNNQGVAGQGHTIAGNFTFPTQVTVIDDAVDIGGGYYNLLAERPDGSIWTWGASDGDDAGTPHSGTPRQRLAGPGWSLHDAYAYYVTEDSARDIYRMWNRWEDMPPSLFSTLEYLPQIESVTSNSATQVDVVFDTASGSLSAASVVAADFAIAGLTVIDATVLADGRTVRLTTSTQTGGTPYVVTVGSGLVADDEGRECATTYGDFTGS